MLLATHATSERGYGWMAAGALKNDRYTYCVTWSEDDNEYVGLCAEFPMFILI